MPDREALPNTVHSPSKCLRCSNGLRGLFRYCEKSLRQTRMVVHTTSKIHRPAMDKTGLAVVTKLGLGTKCNTFQSLSNPKN